METKLDFANLKHFVLQNTLTLLDERLFETDIIDEERNIHIYAHILKITRNELILFFKPSMLEILPIKIGTNLHEFNYIDHEKLKLLYIKGINKINRDEELWLSLHDEWMGFIDLNQFRFKIKQIPLNLCKNYEEFIRNAQNDYYKYTRRLFNYWFNRYYNLLEEVLVAACEGDNRQVFRDKDCLFGKILESESNSLAIHITSN